MNVELGLRRGKLRVRVGEDHEDTIEVDCPHPERYLTRAILADPPEWMRCDLCRCVVHLEDGKYHAEPTGITRMSETRG